MAKAIAAQHPLPAAAARRTDAAAMAAFLLCRRRGWITGQVFAVDGGRSVGAQQGMSAAELRVVLGDQCCHGLASLRGRWTPGDVVLLVEVDAECTYVRHHTKKIVLVLSAMRHFAARAARARAARSTTSGSTTRRNTQSFRGEVLRAAARHAAGAASS